MNYKIPGLLSILLFGGALAVAALRMFQISTQAGLLYSAALPVTLGVMLVFFCRKCPHVANNTCRHVIFGPVIKRLFPHSKPARYTLVELVLAFLPLGAMLIIPQMYLFQKPQLAVLFWTLCLPALLIVKTQVCSSCKNGNCISNPGFLKT